MNNKIIFSEYKLNDLLTLKNRIVMAPMTRAKAAEDFSATKEMAAYYARRADAGLIISEGTIIQPDGLGYRNTPGIFTPKQVNQWKYTTEKVHRNNGLIFSQIWHVGRVSHPSFIQNKLPISPSETIMTNRISRSDGLTYGKSRAASIDEIKVIIDNYAVAAKNAIAAGFDGIEIHGANGYLIDQFLHHHTNLRNDNYGGTPENMARFALEIVKACGDAIGYERVGIRLSPAAYLNEIAGDAKDALVFQYLLTQLNQLPIAYVHTGNFNDTKTFSDLNDMTMSAFIKTHYKGTLIACGSYTFENAVRMIAENQFDLIAFGRPFIANPDLVTRLSQNQVIKQYDVSMLETLY